MKCNKCGIDTDKLMDGMCNECFAASMERLRRASELSIELAEMEINKGASLGMPISRDAIKQVDKSKTMTSDEFKKSNITRKIFVLSLIKMANIDDSRQEETCKDIEWMIDNQLDNFFGRSIRVVKDSVADSINVLASRNNTYIVEVAND